MRAFALASLLVLAGMAPAAASELDDTVAALRAVSISRDDKTVVPPAIVQQEARFKRLLRDEAIRALPDVEADRLDLAALKPALDALAHRYASVDDGADDDGADDARAYLPGAIYGNVLDVHAERPGGRPDLVAIVTNVRVACGADASLALLARRHGRWVVVLEVDSGAIHRIDNAFDLFDYRVSPTAADGSFDVVDAHVTPWCTSNWQALRHAVHRVAAHGPARRIFRATESIAIGVDAPVYEIRPRPAGYALHFTTEGPADDPASSRTCTIAFEVRGDRVRRGRTRYGTG
jgi:hypothetical protein